MKDSMRKNLQVSIILAALVVIMAVAGIITPRFLTVNHLIGILYLNSMLGILALSQTLVILSGGIDMSVGAIYWLVVMIGAQLMGDGALWGPILICLAIGTAIGFINGFCIARLKIPYVVMTLAMMIIITGILYVATGGGGGGKSAEELTQFSIARIMKSSQKGGFNGLPVRTLLWIGFVIVFGFILNRTSFGWKIRSLGSNCESSRLSGIRIERVQILTYTLSGILAVIAGLLYLGQARTPYPTFQSGAGVGANLTLQTIAAVVIGGTMFSGGIGGAGKTMLGVIVTSVLYSVLGMIGLHEEWQVMLNGVIILVIVGAYSRMETNN